MSGRGAELLGQFIGGMPFRLEPDEKRDRSGVHVQRTHDPENLRDLVLVVEGHDPDTVCFQSQPDVRLRLDRVHVQHAGVGGHGAHRGELSR